MNFRKIAMLGAAALTLNGAPALANNFCDAQVASYRGELEGKAAPVFKEIDNGIDQLRKSGNDPDQIGFKMKDGTFKTLPQLRELLTSQKADVSKQIDDAADKCSRELKPMQDVTDAGVTIATLGLNKLLPERMTHIEIGEILAGKPLGGDGALIPHFRDELLSVFRMNPHSKDFVTSIIVDPWKTLTFQR